MTVGEGLRLAGKAVLATCIQISDTLAHKRNPVSGAESAEPLVKNGATPATIPGGLIVYAAKYRVVCTY